MASEIEWSCPKCGSTLGEHGVEVCVAPAAPASCAGFVCDCGDDGEDETHGVAYDNPCLDARCYHCGWRGAFPVPPKGLAWWERRALAAGWTMPVGRAAELRRKDGDDGI